MSADKNILKKMSDQELEKYIQPESRFVPEAIQYAYEILKERGRVLSSQEIERIQSLSVNNIQDKEINPNYIKASNLIYLSGALAITNIIWLHELLNSPSNIFIAFATLIFIFGIGYLISKGKSWVKYLLGGLFLLGLISLPEVITTIKTNLVLATFNIAQTILQAWVIILLFKIPKSN
ncbi:hypothetical protein ASG22_15320 [Chryseobacterium sp. Leaf405]|uniref:hypothetical protein n=1 Tax=Chryseobacterium sp. Leaf405 TaxID=1736367 RepID=UPI0006F97AC0|nr:hypothetical protein [Chryseobacterium sp. Leaf405]KQT21524.1 hypothetical protein ASG22_15320 [Chryseobacterium sp. Leaf405]